MGRTVDFPLIFERSVPGRRGVRPPVCDVPTQPLAELLGEQNLRPEPPALPEVSELDALRHYTRLSQRNYGIDIGFYPLGSCTMKYNPRVNEKIAALAGFTHAHPLQPESLSQGALQLMYELQQDLKAITGFAEVTLQNVAGAHGELLSLMLIKAYHESRGEGEQRKIVLVPDSAHGTNPASAALCGFTVKSIPTNAEGDTDLDALQAALSEEVAAMMLTNPSTLGLFDRNARRACELLHEAGALVFCDGANMNALVGVARPRRHRVRLHAPEPAQDLLHAARRGAVQARAQWASRSGWFRSCLYRASCRPMTGGTRFPTTTRSPSGACMPSTATS
jgi:glycine dehydrogenase subunit 2